MPGLKYKHRLICPALLLAFSAAYAGESAEPFSSIWDRTFQIRAGFFAPDLNSSIRIDSDFGRIGDGLDFERDLGMSESKTTAYGGISWQFAARHVLEWEFFDLGRDGLVTTQKSWNIGDTTILADGQIASTFNVRINRFTYRYRFFENSMTNMSFMAGLHGLRADASLALSGNLIVDGEPIFLVPDDPDFEVEKTELPLPHFGLAVNRSFGPRVFGFATVKGFALKIGDTSGSLIEANTGVQYQLTQNFGIGCGIKWFFLDVREDETERVDVKWDFDFVGPAVYATYTF